MFVELQLVAAETHLVDPPLQVILDPLLMPILILARMHKVLDLHLLQFTDTEEEVAWGDLIAERLADLRDAERQLAVGGIQHVLEVDEHALRRFRAQIGIGIRIGEGTDLGFEHQIEGARLRQLALALAGVELGMFQALCILELILAETAFAGLTVHKRIHEGLLMAGVFPDIFVHQDSGLDALHVVALVDVMLPPEALEIVLQLHAEGAVIVGALHAAVDVAAGKDKAAPFAKRYDLFEVLCCHIVVGILFGRPVTSQSRVCIFSTGPAGSPARRAEGVSHKDSALTGKVASGWKGACCASRQESRALFAKSVTPSYSTA